jgi:hypothetical protein
MDLEKSFKVTGHWILGAGLLDTGHQVVVVIIVVVVIVVGYCKLDT